MHADNDLQDLLAVEIDPIKFPDDNLECPVILGCQLIFKFHLRSYTFKRNDSTCTYLAIHVPI